MTFLSKQQTAPAALFLAAAMSVYGVAGLSTGCTSSVSQEQTSKAIEAEPIPDGVRLRASWEHEGTSYHLDATSEGQALVGSLSATSASGALDAVAVDLPLDPSDLGGVFGIDAVFQATGEQAQLIADGTPINVTQVSSEPGRLIALATVPEIGDVELTLESDEQDVTLAAAAGPLIGGGILISLAAICAMVIILSMLACSRNGNCWNYSMSVGNLSAICSGQCVACGRGGPGGDVDGGPLETETPDPEGR